MPARLCRIIHQKAQVMSFETFYINPESLMIVLLSKHIECSCHLHGIYQSVVGNAFAMFRSTLFTFISMYAQPE